MSSRSVHLRNQAEKCEWHAQNMGDTETQVKLRKLAAQYLAEAEDIESEESGGQLAYSGGLSSLEKTYR
jgi:hypothetical protein